MARILVTGATGFIGKRLVYELLNSSHTVYALVRIKGLAFDDHPNLHFIYGDLRSIKDQDIPKQIDVAYYLVHSMAHMQKDLALEEVSVAKNFICLMEKTSLKQIVFLSGIIEDPLKLSEHLDSRLKVENVIKSSKIPATILRSSIILGAGSASFEIIRDLCEKLPFMIAPKWVRNIAQPIAVVDVLFYLKNVLLNSETYNKTFDIGGPQAMSFKEILQRYSKFRGLKTWILDVPLLTLKLSSYWLFFVTSVRFSLCRYLVESMRYNTRKVNCQIDEIIPHKCLDLEQALTIIFQKIAHNEVVSTWMDAWNFSDLKPDLQKYVHVPAEGCFIDRKIVKLKSDVNIVQDRIWAIGGDSGWFSLPWAWKLRGFIDRLFGGVGLNRGRRDPKNLKVGDSVDFWKVILADKSHHRLILYAQMLLPGEAWLEFFIDEKTNSLIQTATFRPIGFWGRVYWYSSYPFHLLIFSKMAKSIAS